jgi:rubredoxin
MRFLEEDYWDCPFCQKGKIKVLIRPSFLQIRRSRSAAAGTKTKWYKSREEFIVLSAECPNCHKKREEIEKEWEK